jgi:hypothetical protein
MSHIFRTALVVAGACAGLALSAISAADDANSTGLPTYPHIDPKSASMDATYRSLPNGQHCVHFNASTADALETVEAWYRNQMPGAKSRDVNEHSLYGSYFKLQGITLLSGNGIVNVMRMANDKATYLDLFKCRDAAP